MYKSIILTKPQEDTIYVGLHYIPYSFRRGGPPGPMRGMMRGMPPMRGGPMMMRGGPGGPPMQARAGPMGPRGPRDGGRMMNKGSMNNGKNIYIMMALTSIPRCWIYT